MSDAGLISDGYHTFNELYEHRNLLFISLCLANPSSSWIKPTEDYEGYFCLYFTTAAGQISYHIPNKYKYLVEDGLLRGIAQAWDGHTSEEVIKRLQRFAEVGY